MIKNNFYVDNLIVSDDNNSKLMYIYKMAVNGSNKFNFTSKSFYRTRPTKLCVFCDASPHAYGFVMYGVQDGISQIIFAKKNVAPVKSKSLPTLELFTVFIAFKALHFVERGNSDAVLTDIYIFVDTQVVLSWLLKDNIKIKIYS